MPSPVRRPHHRSARGQTRAVLLALLACLSLPGAAVVHAQTLDLEQLFEDRNLEPLQRVLQSGDYELCVRIGQIASQRGLKSVVWRRVHLDALTRLGRLEEALTESRAVLTAFPNDLPVLVRQHRLARELGRPEDAAAALQAINTAARQLPPERRTADDWVALGQAALAAGADAKKVIAQYFQAAQKKDAKNEAAYLAEGWLALEKNDAARAATVFRAGLKNHGETPDLRHGLAAAFLDTDRETAAENIARALELNPSHEGALLQRAELRIGAEKFLDAEADIQSALHVNPDSPLAWALRAAVAFITTSDKAKVEAARLKGLRLWERNPLVDHTIGRVVSRAYRFAEGAAHQRQALAFDPAYLPAQVQLCHDLLRLGEEEEAWKRAAAVRAADGYNVLAHNLGTLEKQIAQFTEHRSQHFTLKMPARDWAIYGPRALELLEEAHQVLTTRYGVPMERPTLIEFFPSQQDFAIRTFGNLGGQGILGACFGSLVTMNSPGSLGHGRNNWESTLWHEFCHVVTLTATRNRMPRWLSEGISVHEEGLRDPAWGMPMTADFRKMILEGEATPVSQLSQAFLSPKTPDHLMFAYFQAGQVVRFLVDRHGQDALRAIMTALASGTRVNDALSAHASPIETFETAFADHLRAQAEAFGAKADWSEPEPADLNPADPDSLAAYLKEHPSNLHALNLQLSRQLQAADWEQAIPTADRLITLVPEDVTEAGPAWAKARALRELGRAAEEIVVLRGIAQQQSSAMNAFLRLIELETDAEDWPQVVQHARRALALNPFLRTPNEALARAARALGDSATAITALNRLLQLDPSNPAQLRFQLAELLQTSDTPAARRHLLDALADAPRYREAHELLRQMPPAKGAAPASN